jgi:hypothetical protein
MLACSSILPKEPVPRTGDRHACQDNLGCNASEAHDDIAKLRAQRGLDGCHCDAEEKWGNLCEQEISYRMLLTSQMAGN